MDFMGLKMALSKQDKQIYLRAAESIAENESGYACCAISEAVNEIEGSEYDANHRLRLKFATYFQPKFGFEEDGVGWFGLYTEENQLARSLALLSMLYCEE